MSVDIAMISACTHITQDDRARVVVAEALGQVAVGDDAELRRQVLDQHRHQVRGEHDPQQQVAELARRPGCSSRSCRGRRRRSPRRTPGRASRASRAAGPSASSCSSALGTAIAVGSPRTRRRAVGARTLEGRAQLACRQASPRPTSSSTRIARVEARRRCARRRARAAEAHEQRAAERLALDAPRAARRARCPARPGSGASRGRRPRRARSARRRRSAARRGATVSRSSQVELGARDRVAVRVDGGVPELGRDQLLEILGEHVLEHLGLGVHAVPGHPEHLGQVAAPAGGGGGSPRARSCRPSASGARRGRARADQPELVEALEHRRDRARRDAEPLGERFVETGSRGAIRARRSPSRSPRRPACGRLSWWPWKKYMACQNFLQGMASPRSSSNGATCGFSRVGRATPTATPAACPLERRRRGERGRGTLRTRLRPARARTARSARPCARAGRARRTRSCPRSAPCGRSGTRRPGVLRRAS